MILYTGQRNNLPVLKPHPDLKSVKQWLLEDAAHGDDLRIEGYPDLPAPMSVYRYDWELKEWVGAAS